MSRITKKYSHEGASVLSDCHSAYINLRSGISRLARYGFYHFWINHSHYYVHEKFPFV